MSPGAKAPGDDLIHTHYSRIPFLKNVSFGKN